MSKGGPSPYDQKTPAKQAFGARLREARLLAGLSEAQAAAALGYTQPVHVSYWETGTRLPPTTMLVRIAAAYGVTCDFLCGATADPEADPGAALVRLLQARAAVEVDRLIEALAVEGLTELRRARPETAQVLRLASAALEAERALARCRELSPAGFDELPGGAPVLARVELAATLAATILNGLRLGGRLTMPAGTEKGGRDGH